MHLSPEDLLGFIDGELDTGKSPKVIVHLGSCESCRKKADALKKSVLLVRQADALELSDIKENTPDPESGIEELKSRIGDWNKSHPELAANHESGNWFYPGDYDRLICEMEVFLGHDFSLRILREIEDGASDAPNLPSAIEPVLSQFLGRDSGQAATLRILSVAGGPQNKT